MSNPRQPHSSRGRRIYGNGRAAQNHRGDRPNNGNNFGRNAPNPQYRMPVPRERTQGSISESNAANECFVCCREILIYAIGVCDHPVCYTCSTRLRVLCSTNECPVCRASMEIVFFVKEVASYGEIDTKGYTLKEERYGMFFENEDVSTEYKKLLIHECKECIRRSNISKRSGERAETPEPYDTFRSLVDHVQNDHRRHFCDLCVTNLRLFTFERQVYSKSDLRRHMDEGDLDDKSYKGHPRCDFCNEHYFDKDELYKHMRVDHFTCFLCKDDNVANRVFQYYATYDHLRDHFEQKHYYCGSGECAAKRFIAFSSELEYKAHFASNHSEELSREEQRAARNVVLDFNSLPEGREIYNSDGRRTLAAGRERYRRRPRSPVQDTFDEEVAPLPPPEPEVDMSSTTEFPSLLGDSCGASAKPFMPTPQYGKQFAVKKTQEDFPTLGEPSNPRRTVNPTWSNGAGRIGNAQSKPVTPKSAISRVRAQPVMTQLGPSRTQSNPVPDRQQAPQVRPKTIEELFPSLPQSDAVSDFGKVLKPLPTKQLRKIISKPQSSVQNGVKSQKETKVVPQRPSVRTIYEPSRDEESEEEKPVYDPVSALAENLKKIKGGPTKSERKQKLPHTKAENMKKEEFPSLGPASAQVAPMEVHLKPRYKGLKPGQASETIKQKSGEFIQPPHFTKRSSEHMGLIKLLLNGASEPFNEYRSLLSDLRKGQLEAAEFVSECLRIFEDKEEFTKIFLELVFLMSEIPIQNDLIILYDDLKQRFRPNQRKTKEWTRCSDCGQITAPEDSQGHSRSH